MFSGIIETQGKVTALKKEQKNLHITINSAFTSQLKIDQSIAHNGVCLTVVEINGKNYTVTAINETLQKTNLSKLKKGDLVNLERCMKIGDRIDGHIVQGHVDCTAVCKKIINQKGSWLFEFEPPQKNKEVQLLTVTKGAICVNGVSLTIVNVTGNKFSVAIIPYTYKYTNFSKIKKGSIVNIEFDVIGKYVINYLK